MAMAKDDRGEARRRLDRLSALSIDATRQLEYALELLPGEANADVFTSVLRVLGKYPTAAARTALIDRYERIDIDGKRRDPGGGTRSAILRALRDIANAGERDLYLRATRTYEPGIQDRGNPALVRAAGLINLSNIDRDAAVYRAIELLGDRSCMESTSLEPDLTAIRILGEAEAYPAQLLLLLTGEPKADLAAEALRGLCTAPEPALGHVVAKFLGHRSEVVLLGVCDILIENRAPSLLPAFEQLLGSGPPDVVRYLATAAVASRRPEFGAPLARAAGAARSRAHMEVLAEALALAHDPACQAALSELGRRLEAVRPEEPAKDEDDDDS